MKPTSGLSLKKRKIENGEKILTEGVEEKNSSHGMAKIKGKPSFSSFMIHKIPYISSLKSSDHIFFMFEF